MDDHKNQALKEMSKHSPELLSFIKEVVKNFGKPEESVIYVNRKLFVFGKDV